MPKLTLCLKWTEQRGVILDMTWVSYLRQLLLNKTFLALCKGNESQWDSPRKIGEEKSKANSTWDKADVQRRERLAVCPTPC